VAVPATLAVDSDKLDVVGEGEQGAEGCCLAVGGWELVEGEEFALGCFVLVVEFAEGDDCLSGVCGGLVVGWEEG